MSQNDFQSEWPSVSVIIPFYNNQDQVVRIEEHLRNQTYPESNVEVIFVDNGSEKAFQFRESFLKRNILLTEKKYLNSPYSARNRGVEAAKGELIVFVDANSTPENDWLKHGVKCLRDSGCDLIGGNVLFDFQYDLTAAKIVDSLTSIQMKNAIGERGVAYTANLFVKRDVFDRIGLFEEGVRSGGDVRWTLKAKNYKYNIGYCSTAVVKKYARSAKELYHKKLRTGKGYYYTWIKEPKTERKPWYYNFFRSLKPPSFSKIRELNPERYRKEFDQKLGLIWIHFYALGILEQVAFISEFIRGRKK